MHALNRRTKTQETLRSPRKIEFTDYKKVFRLLIKTELDFRYRRGCEKVPFCEYPWSNSIRNGRKQI